MSDMQRWENDYMQLNTVLWILTGLVVYTQSLLWLFSYLERF